MPTSKETLVRVDGFSKISASDLPTRDWGAVRRVRLHSLPISRMRLSSPESSRSRSRKCRCAAMSCSLAEAFGGGLDHGQRLIGLAFGDDERRQEANHVLARAHGQEPVLAQGHDYLTVRLAALEPQHQAAAAHLFEDRAVAGDRFFELLAQLLA